MISGLIPHRYAMALYKYAQESDSQEPIYEAMKTVLGAYSENKDLQKTLSNPYVKTDCARLSPTARSTGSYNWCWTISGKNSSS